jgi:hypothetical protein
MFYTQQFLINFCLIKHHVIKTYEGVEVQSDPFLTSALDRDEWSALGSGRFTHWDYWIGGWVRGWGGMWRREKCLTSTRIELRFLGFSAHNLVTIPSSTVSSSSFEVQVNGVEFYTLISSNLLTHSKLFQWEGQPITRHQCTQNTKMIRR